MDINLVPLGITSSQAHDLVGAHFYRCAADQMSEADPAGGRCRALDQKHLAALFHEVHFAVSCNPQSFSDGLRNGDLPFAGDSHVPPLGKDNHSKSITASTETQTDLLRITRANSQNDAADGCRSGQQQVTLRVPKKAPKINDIVSIVESIEC